MLIITNHHKKKSVVVHICIVIIYFFDQAISYFIFEQKITAQREKCYIFPQYLLSAK